MLGQELAESLASAAHDADLYHHMFCRLLDDTPAVDDEPAACSCPAPGLLRALAEELGVLGKHLSTEELLGRIGARLQERCAA